MGYTAYQILSRLALPNLHLRLFLCHHGEDKTPLTRTDITAIDAIFEGVSAGVCYPFSNRFRTLAFTNLLRLAREWLDELPPLNLLAYPDVNAIFNGRAE